MSSPLGCDGFKLKLSEASWVARMYKEPSWGTPGLLQSHGPDVVKSPFPKLQSLKPKVRRLKTAQQGGP